MNTNTSTNAADGKLFFGVTYCKVSYRVKFGTIGRYVDAEVMEFLPATPEHIAAFEDIEFRCGRGDVDCFIEAEKYFAENNAVRERKPYGFAY